MSRRRVKSDLKAIGKLIEGAFYLFYFLILLSIFVTKVLINILAFFIRMIMFYKTQYKVKSGNGFFKTYFDKGFWGEYQLYRRLIKVFGEDKLLTNIYLSSKNVDNTEIDVLGVHNGIVYCYEVKNYGGHIYGNIENKNWTQVLMFRTKNKFYNPFRQNYAHVKALEEYLKIDESNIISMVVFSDRANLDNVHTRGKIIYRISDNFIISENRKGELTDDVIIDKLTSKTNVDQLVKEEHINQVNEIKN